MASIFGFSDLSIVEQKVQNQTASPGVTDFAGVLEQNGTPVALAAVGGYLPLSGGTMTGNIGMGTHNITSMNNANFIDNIGGIVPAAGGASIYASNSDLRYTTSDAVEHVVANTTDLSVIDNAFGSVAPAGNRDLYTNTTALGSVLNYISQTNILYASRPTVSGLTYYSTNGGVTWTPPTFSGTAPTGTSTMTYGYDGAGTYAALSGLSTNPPYTSADGITYTSGTPIGVGFSGVISTSIEWFPDQALFVAGNGDPLNAIMTSPDGLSWSFQSTPDQVGFGIFSTIIVTPNLIVMCGGNENSIIYSNDAFSWGVVSGIPTNVRFSSLIHSPERSEWYAQDVTGVGYRSINGVDWAVCGATGIVGAITGIWVAEYGLYYIPASVGGAIDSMALYYTPNLNTPFQGSYLDGANSDPTGYEVMVYLPTYDRFVIGNSTNGLVYSTARPLALKSMGDAIRVRSFPVSASVYSIYTSGTAITNTTTETSLLAGVSAIGSLAGYAPHPLGMAYRVLMSLIATSVAGDTLTIRLKIAGTAVLTLVLTIPALAANLVVISDDQLVVQATDVRVISRTFTGATPTVATTLVTYNVNATNPITLTAQWSANASSCQLQTFNVEASFPNGA